MENLSCGICGMEHPKGFRGDCRENKNRYPKQDTEKTVVVFRVWKKGGDVIALFPGIDEGRGFCSSYEHIGQHSGADYRHCIYQTTPARPEDYYDLMKELEGLGYNLKIQKRFTR